MSGHVAEACVTVSEAKPLARQICIRIATVCQRITITEGEILLTFDGGIAVIRSIGNTLLFRVQALDLPTFHGIQTLLEGSLSEMVRALNSPFDWRGKDQLTSPRMRPTDHEHGNGL